LFTTHFTSTNISKGIVTGAMGVIFFIYNAIFSLVLLIMVLVASLIAMFAKNPDTRYQPMRDDRGSFIKSQTQLNTELDALGATARGEGKHNPYAKGNRLDDDDDSWSGDSSGISKERESTAYAGYVSDASKSPRPEIFPSNDSQRHLPPFDRSATASPYSDQQRSFRANNASPKPWQRGAGYE
jgi:hypothetical protein